MFSKTKIGHGGFFLKKNPMTNKIKKFLYTLEHLIPDGRDEIPTFVLYHPLLPARGNLEHRPLSGAVCHQLTSLFLARDPNLGCTLAAACCCHSATDPVITLIVSAMSACLRSRHTRQHSCQLQPVNYSISNISAPGPGPGFRGDIWRPADM